MTLKTVTLHLYELLDDWRAERHIVDSFDLRTIPDCMKDKVWLGQVDVELDFPDIDLNAAQIEALEAEIQKERADSQVRVNLLLDRIGKLKAIGHNGGDV